MYSGKRLNITGKLLTQPQTGQKRVKLSCDYMCPQDLYFLTILAVDFDCVRGELESCSTFARLRKPEILHLTVSAQHVHIQHWEEVGGEDGRKKKGITHRLTVQKQSMMLNRAPALRPSGECIKTQGLL